MTNLLLQAIPTEGNALLGWIVAGLLGIVGGGWRLYERRRDKVEADLKIENAALETKLESIVSKYESKIADLETKLEAANEKYVREIKANAKALDTARETTRRVLRDSGYPAPPELDGYDDTTGVTHELNELRRQAIAREAALKGLAPDALPRPNPPPPGAPPPTQGSPARRRPAVEENVPRGRYRTDR